MGVPRRAVHEMTEAKETIGTPFKKGDDPRRYTQPAREETVLSVTGYTLPDLCRMRAPACVDLLTAVIEGRDPETDEPIKYPIGQRLRAVEIILNRGFGSPVNQVQLKQVQSQHGNLAALDLTELHAIASQAIEPQHQGTKNPLGEDDRAP